MEQEQLLAPDLFDQVSASDPWSAWVAMHQSTGTSWLSALQYCDLQGYLPLDILTKVDRMTMAHSIEARPPLLDHKLVEFAATIPATMALRGQTTKYLFKRAMRGRLPDSIIERPKQGFAIPLARWFRGSWSDYVRDILLSDTCRQRGIFNPRYIERLLRVLDGGRDLELELWTLVSFELWCRQYLDRPAGTLIRHRHDLVELSA
jgi:asparagine synthase (glutamine-hydrolysing)